MKNNTFSVKMRLLLLGITLSLQSETNTAISPSPTTLPIKNSTLPSSVIDLSAWKLTLPIPDPDKTGKPSPWELGTPDLDSFSSPPWFAAVRDSDGAAVQFRAAHGSVTTSGSKNPRSELREMQPHYPRKHSDYAASWGIDDGQTHILWIRQKVTHLTSVKPHTVCGQIHDAKDDVTVFRIEGNEGGTPGAEVKTAKVWITDGEDTHAYLLDPQYLLGTVFSVKFIVKGGTIHYEYNDKPVPYTQTKKNIGCYFKLGNYTQSNSKTAPNESDSAYAESLIYAYKLEHKKE